MMNYNWKELLETCRETSGRARAALCGRVWPLEELWRVAALPDEDEPYGRHLLYRDAGGEVLLVRWRPGQFCAPHDHSASTGYVCVLAGALVERHWAWDGKDLVQTAEHRFAAPETIPVAGIHSMMAVDGGLSLHIYLPGVSGMRVYDIARRETLVVADDCGAWVPRRESLIIVRAPWGE
jgi:predicted metal-dependent enzyme (double-stranded beta helix superfamily)